MTFGVSGGRYQDDSGQDLCLTGQLLVAGARGVDQLGQGVVDHSASSDKLAYLGEDRLAGEEGIASTMVEVQVAVRDKVDVVHADIDRAQCQLQAGPSRAIVLIHPWIASHAGVEQQGALRMDDQVTQAGFHARLSGARLFRRAHEVAEVHSPHSHVIHARSMAVRRPQPRPETTLVTDPSVPASGSVTGHRSVPGHRCRYEHLAASGPSRRPRGRCGCLYGAHSGPCPVSYTHLTLPT